MKIAIKQNNTAMTQDIVAELVTLCAKENICVDNDRPDVVVSVGGDGTLLSAFHAYKDQLDTVRFVAIHTGHLGFYTDFLAYEVPELVQYLKQDTIPVTTYPLLQVEYVDQQGVVTKALALNEMTLKTVSATLVCEVYIGDSLFEVFRGDGLCVATPTGSTGISKSLGGAVLHPAMPALQLTEIASLNNRVYRTLGSPLILPKSEVITLKIKNAMTPFITMDNLEPQFLDVANLATIRISVADEPIQFAAYKKLDFWTRVESAFIGDINRKEMEWSTSSTSRYMVVKSDEMSRDHSNR